MWRCALYLSIIAITYTIYVNFMLSEGFYPAHCTELHNLEGVFVQIDIIFVSSDKLKLKALIKFFHKTLLLSAGQLFMRIIKIFT